VLCQIFPAEHFVRRSVRIREGDRPLPYRPPKFCTVFSEKMSDFSMPVRLNERGLSRGVCETALGNKFQVQFIHQEV
jgi:hypothetical protein